MTNTNTTLTSSPSVFYAVDGSPDDYRFVLRGADLVLIDHGNVEHVFLFVGNIMSVDGQVEMRFSSGATLHAEDLFKRAELIDLQTFYEEELEWDATNEEGEQKEGNTPLPDGQDVPQSDMEAKDIQAAPVQNLKQQLMQALQENDNTGRQIFEEIPNRNRWLVPNTNTSDKQGSADDVKPGEVPRHLLPPKFALTDDTNSGSKLDEVTNFTRPHFEGTADPEASVTLYVNNSAVATTTASTTGKFIFQFDQPLADGNYSVYVQSSKYGLTARSETAPLVIDTTSPLLPSINLAKVSDLGYNDYDKVTKDSQPVLEGAYAPGQAFEKGLILTVEARPIKSDTYLPIGEAVVQADGRWSFRLATALPNATYNFQLSAQDAAGNKTLPGTSELIKVTIDTKGPGQDPATLTVDTFNPAMDRTNFDFITSSRQFGLRGSAERWVKLYVYVNGIFVGEGRAVENRQWSIAPGTLKFGVLSVPNDTTSLADGIYMLSIIPVDRAGNAGAKFQTKLVIDTTIDAPALSIGNLIDSSDDSLLTGVQPEFTVRGESNSTGEFTLVDAATSLPVATPLHFRLDPDAQSSTFVLPENLADGSYVATFTNMDAAGNERSTTLSFNVDATPPVIDQVALNTESNTGTADDAANPVTKAKNPVIVGVSEAGAAITVEVRDDKGTADTSDDTVYVAKTVAGDDGSWSVAVPSRDVIPEGNYSVTVTATDKAGNAAVARDISFEINREVSLVPGSFRMGAGDSPYTASSAPSFSWEALEMVTASFLFYKSGVDTPLFSVTPSAADLATVDGVTTWTPSSLALPDGQYTVKAVFTDTEAGNETDPNENSVTFTVDTIPPDAPTITIGDVTADNVLNAAEAAGDVTVTGTTTDASEGDEVTLTVNGQTYTGAVAADGSFSINVAGADLAVDADTTIEASLTTYDLAGNSATGTASHGYGVDITPPATPTITIDPVTADNVLNASEASGNVTVTGTATDASEGDVITLTVNGNAYTGVVAADGSFSMEIAGADLKEDANIEASLTTSDAAGNFATGTASHGYSVDITPPTTPTITLDPVTADNVLNASEASGNVTVTGTATDASEGDVITLTVNGNAYTGVVAADGSFSMEIAGADLKEDANIEASLTTYDAVGNSATGTASHGYGVDITPPATPTITIDPVAADNVLNMTEAAGDVTVTGMTTNTTEGDWVTLTVNGVEHTGQVDSDGNFSINVAGSDLAADADTTIEASVTTFDPAGNFATDGCDHAYATSSMVHADFDLSGALQDDNPGDTLALDDVETLRATISGDLDGDGTTDSLTMDAEVSETGTWSLHFSQELAVGDYNLNLSALAADGSPVALASTTDLTYDFSVLAKDMLADPADSQILFNEAAENTEPAGSETPAPGAVDTVTIVDPHVTIEEHVL